jgi:methylmalonyl-CoA mutase cobalamin-binding subunit
VTGATQPLFDRELPKGSLLVEQGRALGAETPVGRTAFHDHYNVGSEVEHKLNRASRGELTWSMIMGLASLDEQVEGLREMHAFGQETGVVIDRGLVIPNWLTGLPPEMRAAAPKGTSFVLDGEEAHRRIAQAAPIMPCFNDWHIGSPEALRNTADAVKAGGTYHGVLAQYSWTLPGVDDEVWAVGETVKAIGLIAAKRDDRLVVDSYLDDGLPSRFADLSSYVGYALLERYVVTDLCGARYATGFGQLIADIPSKTALWLALHEALKADHPPISYLYGNTIDASDRLVTGNFGISAAEMAVFAVAERRYRTGVSILPNPATEKLRVPTMREILDVHEVARAAAAKSAEFERLIDFGYVEQLKTQMVAQGRQFCANALAGMAGLAVDIRDPLHVLLALRELGGETLERLYHPGERDDERPNGIVPVVEAEFTKRSRQAIEDEIAMARASGLADRAPGRRFIVASADTHSFALHVITRTLGRLGAEVIEAGVDRDPPSVVALAARHGWPDIAVSLHNGQCLDYARQLRALLADAPPSLRLFFGGKLNRLTEEANEPVDASDELRLLGIVPCVSVLDMLAE